MPVKKAAAKKASSPSAAAKKTAAKKTVAKKTVAKKAVAKKTVAKKTVAKKAVAKKAAVKKAPTKKAATKAAVAKTATTKKKATTRTAVPTTAPPPPTTPARVLAPPDREPTVVELGAPQPRAEGITVTLEGPQSQQRRVTVAFRIILALPHLIFSALVWIVASVAVFIGWFAALFTGRMPLGIATFVARTIQYGGRVSAYASLLFTDKYPSFSLDAPDGSVTLQVGTTKLNRAAVFFRLILLIPTYIVFTVVKQGLTLASFFIWLIVLIKGRLPQSLFEAEAAILRYRIRFHAYWAMLTGIYPAGLFGDKPDAASTDAAALPAEPRLTRLVLSKAAKRIIAVLLVIGAITTIGSVALSAAFNDNTETIRVLEDAHDDLTDAIEDADTGRQSCALSGGADCLHEQDRNTITAFGSFARTVADLEFFESEFDDVEELFETASQIVTTLQEMATINDAGAYSAAANRLDELLDEFEDQYDDLIFDLAI